jgi:NAD(P)-dependent dehydrogenase (short-subunit alcohol dehydrogenase family)
MTPLRVLVTGGQQGIGLGITRALHAAGHAVTVAAEAPEDAPAVAALPPGASYLRHDLRDLAAIPALLDAAGPLDALVSNAGVPSPSRGDLLDVTPEAFDHVLAVNLRGGFFLAQAVARRMLAAPADRPRALIFVTSVSAAMVSIERGDYCVSKAGAAMTAALFAARLAPHGIGVYELRPGVVATPMTAPVAAAYDARIAAGLVPARRWGAPDDVASVVIPLVEGRFAFATGAVIPVDGGLSIPRL